MESLPESVLLKIFSHFHLDELLRLSRVNSNWRRLSHDWCLWRKVSLSQYSKSMTDFTLRKLIRSLFSVKLLYLDLTKFYISSSTLNLLSKHCPRLQTIILKHVTFHESYKKFPEILYFPRNLKELDISYSTGPISIYRNIMASLETQTLEYFAVPDNFLELFLENQSAFLNFFLRQRLSLKTLEFSFCKQLTDELLSRIMLCCRNLRSVCTLRCLNIKGQFLNSGFNTCPYIRTLILNGTSIKDEQLKNANWHRCLLVELDISWCRHISEEGLLYTLPTLNRFLRYLYVSCCGYGHALTDQVLQEMSGKSWRFLNVLDVSNSYEITNQRLHAFLLKCPNISKICKINCPNLMLEERT